MTNNYYAALFGDEPTVGLSATVLNDGNDVFVAKVTASLDGYLHFEATGSSRRDPSDPENYELGLKLAVGRALRDLGRQIHREAQEDIRIQSDKDKRQAEAQAEAHKRKNERRALHEQPVEPVKPFLSPLANELDPKNFAKPLLSAINPE